MANIRTGANNEIGDAKPLWTTDWRKTPTKASVILGNVLVWQTFGSTEKKKSSMEVWIESQLRKGIVSRKTIGDVLQKQKKFLVRAKGPTRCLVKC